MLQRRRFLAILGLAPLTASAGERGAARFVCFQRGKRSPTDDFTCWYGLNVGGNAPAWETVATRGDGLPASPLYVPPGGTTVADYRRDCPFPAALETCEPSIRIESEKIIVTPLEPYPEDESADLGGKRDLR